MASWASGSPRSSTRLEHRASGITVLQAADLIGQARVSVAIDLGLGVGDHIQQCLGDGQVIALVAQVVVTAVQCQVALVDAIHTHVLACGAVQPTGQDRTGGITVLQAADLVGQARIGIAVDLGLGVGDHIQQRLGDGQVVALVSQVIVTADQTQATLLNRIVAYVFAGDTNQAAAIEHRASGITVLQAADLIGQSAITLSSALVMVRLLPW